MPLPVLCRPLPIFRKFRADRRGVTAVEAGIILPIFLVFLLVLFEVAYDQFFFFFLESSLQQTAYQMQVNTPPANGNACASDTCIDDSSSAAKFVDSYLCPNSIAHLLACGNLYVRVQQFNTAACADFWQATDGTVPVTGGQLQLGNFAGEQAGSGTKIGPTNCESAAATGGIGYCNPGPNEYVILTAVYVAPTFLDALIPGRGYTYGGNFVHAAYATSAFYTENFPNVATPALPC